MEKRTKREQRHLRVRKKVLGTPERPRLNVYRSLSNIYAQLIDDSKGVTLVAASTLEPEVREKFNSANTEAAKLVGTLVAERALAKGIKRVVFDRGGFLYHGRVKALADGARDKGLEL